MSPAYTYTRTYAIMDPWAETTPVEDNPENKPRATEGDLCAVSDCCCRLRADEVCYSPVELSREDAVRPGGEPWVCWRHIRPDDGPLRV